FAQQISEARHEQSAEYTVVKVEDRPWFAERCADFVISPLYGTGVDQMIAELDPGAAVMLEDMAIVQFFESKPPARRDGPEHAWKSHSVARTGKRVVHLRVALNVINNSATKEDAFGVHRALHVGAEVE